MPGLYLAERRRDRPAMHGEGGSRRQGARFGEDRSRSDLRLMTLRLEPVDDRPDLGPVEKRIGDEESDHARPEWAV